MTSGSHRDVYVRILERFDREQAKSSEHVVVALESV